MKERPILFNGAMVRAILDGRKTQTRRAVMLPHPWEIEERDDGSSWPWYPDYVTGGEWDGWVPCPFGQPGDRLWVRETWKTHSTFDHLTPRDVPQSKLFYAADNRYNPSGSRWRPSIHMPRWACRLVLEITSVRVERLHQISEADAAAEGIDYQPDGGELYRPWRGDVVWWEEPVRAFRDLWTSTGGDWSANPWVWVISFRRVEG